MNSRTRHTTLIESGDRWPWAQHGRRFKSLAAALRADDKDAAEIARAINGKVVTIREIVPNTRVGALIAKGLTD